MRFTLPLHPPGVPGPLVGGGPGSESSHHPLGPAAPTSVVVMTGEEALPPPGMGGIRIKGPLTTLLGLRQLRPLWIELHLHHRDVAQYTNLVQDIDASWRSRLRLYEGLLEQGAFYFVARDAHQTPVGYAFCGVTVGDDDTFLVQGGIAELVTLVVARDLRGKGIGAHLVTAVESVVAMRGIDTMKIAVMEGNEGAARFYADAGYQTAERVMYRRLSPFE